MGLPRSEPETATAAAAPAFFGILVDAVCFKIEIGLTDNGIQLA